VINVIRQLNADNADVLNGTDLENIPASAGVLPNGVCGQLDIYVASSQADHTLNIRRPNADTPMPTQAIQQKTNSVISLNDDLPISLPAIPGRMIISLDVVTAGTDNLIIVYRDLSDLGIV